jgi:hypothetical protein
MADPIDSALLPGETVLWRGRPSASARGPSPAAIRFVALLGALAAGLGSALTVYALAAAIRHGDHFEWPLLLMLALVTLALFAACVRFVLLPVRPSFGDDERTHYAVTSRRVIVAADTSPPAFSALAIDAALDAVQTIAADGQGSLVFRNANDGQTLMFDGVADAGDALQFIRTVQDSAP